MAACAPKLGVVTLAAPAGGATGTVAVTAASGCAWSATTAASWIALSPASGSGSGSALGGDRRRTPGWPAARWSRSGAPTLTVSQAADVIGPAGTVAIAGGLTATATLPVNLVISATDPNGVAAMCLSNGATCTAWEPYATTKAWTLAAGVSGARTVSAWFKDGRGNVSGPTKAAIAYDVVAPTGGAVKLVRRERPAHRELERLRGRALQGRLLPGGHRGGDGAGDLRGRHRRSTRAPASPPSSTGLTNGTVYGVRVCAVDDAGNVSLGAVASAHGGAGVRAAGRQGDALQPRHQDEHLARRHPDHQRHRRERRGLDVPRQRHHLHRLGAVRHEPGLELRRRGEGAPGGQRLVPRRLGQHHADAGEAERDLRPGRSGAGGLAAAAPTGI